MGSVNLLDIDVDSLFEQFGVNEIDQVHKRLESSIEDKKEELRVMVGERYRDLLHAADTIAEMQKTSANVSQCIGAVIKNCQNVNEHRLLGFRTEARPQPSDSSAIQNEQYYGCVAQIHLLMTLPELIWSHLDDCDYFVATQLFILSRHISTGLQLDANHKILRKFPVAKRQCTHLQQFFFVIKQLCIEQLEQPELDADKAVKCLASLLLLENCKFEKLLTMFIQLRTRAYRRLFSSRMTGAPKAKDKILSSLKVLDETLLLIYTCFVRNEDNRRSPLLVELEQIGGMDAQPTINLIELENEAIQHSLSPLILKFRPQLSMCVIESAAIKEALDDWMRTTSGDASKLLSDVVGNISSVRTIHNINQAVLESAKPADWSQVLQQLNLGKSLDFYEMYYRPLLQNRVKEIVRSSWSAAKDVTHKEITSFIDASDAKWTITRPFWDASPDDTPLSLKQALNSQRENRRLLMKMKGFSESICSICRILDENAHAIHRDLNLYINADSANDGYMPKRTRLISEAEQEEIIAHLRQCTQDAITQLIGDIKALASRQNDQQHIIFLARILKAFTEICPHVRQCLVQSSLLLCWSRRESSASESPTTSSEHWDRICRLLAEESLNMWKHWAELFLAERLKPHGGHCFRTAIDLVGLLSFLPKWETILVEEKDDANQIIESKVRVPNHPSIPLHQFLFGLCRGLNAIVPNTLPRPVTASLTAKVLATIVETYSLLLSQNAFIASNQNASIQFYFDLKLVSLMFSDERRSEDCQNLIAKFKSNIDPFDFELLGPYMNGNVKSTAQRMQHLYGALVPNNQQLNLILSTLPKPGVGTANENESNVLPLCAADTNHRWFSLLPIGVAARNKESNAESIESEAIVPAEKTKNEKAKRSSPSRAASTPSSAQQNLANVKSNAAAFFGAMSQDWFK